MDNFSREELEMLHGAIEKRCDYHHRSRRNAQDALKLKMDDGHRARVEHTLAAVLRRLEMHEALLAKLSEALQAHGGLPGLHNRRPGIS